MKMDSDIIDNNFAFKNSEIICHLWTCSAKGTFHMGRRATDGKAEAMHLLELVLVLTNTEVHFFSLYQWTIVAT